ncbi:hypothetical protein [Aeromicrobium sp.]|uniref:hypothetical protein n=1 Tax=Aeromicrobium sp. TaxID=1871063 RepID=UPI0030C0234E
MNPRHRRLLIPGLLLALLVVVLVSSLARNADGAPTGPVVVSRLSDPRILESSGLAVSQRHEDLAYTINDSGADPVVYAIKISTGAVLGTTTIAGGSLLDTEAIALDGDGRLWVADTGDNQESRGEVAIYAFLEPGPGPGDRTVTAKRYPITYESGPVDVEALLIDRRTGAKALISKELVGGRVLSLPDRLSTTGRNEATEDSDGLPLLVTDGTLTADGRYALLRTYTSVLLYDATTWKLISSDEASRQPQGESIAIERSGRSFLIGSEGAGSTLIRMPLTLPTPQASSGPATPDPGRGQPSDAEPPADNGFAGATWFWAAGVMALLAAIAVAATRRT